MRRTLGTSSLILAAVLTLGLSACGQDTGDTATDQPLGQSSPPTTEPTPETETESNGPVPFTQVALITNTEEEGTVSTTPVTLDSAGAVTAFGSQFTGSRMTEDIRTAVSKAPDVGPDQTLVGAVLVIGCDRPTDVTVERVAGVVQVSPVLPKSQVQCFAPQTSVAILVIDTVTIVPAVPGVS